VRIDLHTHSRVSDGTDEPAELVRLAAAAGLDVVALTDHDTAAGWEAAETAARAVGITLVRGMEISTRHDHRSAHLLAYLPDPTHPALAAQLDAVLDGRAGRMPEIVARLAAQGLDISEADVEEAAGASAAAGRPHIADALVRRGVVASRDEAFARWLDPGRPGHVPRYAPETGDAVAVVAEAGGASVLAHPWGRHGSRTMDADALAALRERGLTGIEVDHQDHDPDARSALRAIADDLDLVATGSSDYHGTGKVDHDLGVNLTDPEAYDRLLAAAAAASAASGRRTPPVVG
jgi:3',5'-nucleoside bisphosphate phosphatase